MANLRKKDWRAAQISSIGHKMLYEIHPWSEEEWNLKQREEKIYTVNMRKQENIQSPEPLLEEWRRFQA